MLKVITRSFLAAASLAVVFPLGAQANPLNPTRLPLGDGKVSSSAQRGSVWSCNAQFSGRGGAHLAGPWIKSDGTYDFTAKPTVDGSVKWPTSFTITKIDSVRRITGNDLPDHPTGVFPVGRGDDAFQYDRNPNPIQSQTFSVEMKATPALAARASCLPMGAVGVLLSGGYFFNALDLNGQDAVAHEIQDQCQGHPQAAGAYHYHNLSECVADTRDTLVHAKLVGYAFDGFGIFGKRGERGKLLANSDLDECHGHTHAIEWDGRNISMYHYHATWEYPYTIGCFRGTPAASAPLQGRGRGRGQPAAQQAASQQTATQQAAAQQSPISVITLGSGAPRYDSTRAGPTNAIKIGNRYIIVDVGNGAQGRLQQAGILLEQIDAVFITHHHLDHDQELMPLIITTLVRGNAPEIVGSPGTVSMINFMKQFYAEDIAYRMGRAPSADIDPNSLKVRDVSGGEQFKIGTVAVRTAKVDHSIYTVAYRFDLGGRSVVISGDLTYSQSLIDLARGADILVIDSGVLPGPNGEPARGAGARAGRAGRAAGAGAATGTAAAARGGARAGREGRGGDQAQRAHPSMAEVASMASQAGVKCLVLTHLNQTLVDIEATRAAYKPLFAGTVIVASDGKEITPACQ